MSTIKVRHTHVFEFVKGGDCEDCLMRDYCNETFEQECESGEAGHYDEVDEEIEQIEDDGEDQTTESVSR